MSTKTVANSEPWTSKTINSLEVRTLTGLDLEQAIIENAKRRIQIVDKKIGVNNELKW